MIVVPCVREQPLGFISRENGAYTAAACIMHGCRNTTVTTTGESGGCHWLLGDVLLASGPTLAETRLTWHVSGARDLGMSCVRAQPLGFISRENGAYTAACIMHGCRNTTVTTTGESGGCHWLLGDLFIALGDAGPAITTTSSCFLTSPYTVQCLVGGQSLQHRSATQSQHACLALRHSS